MYNIQKLADEIFKAPTIEDLVERAEERFNKDELVEALSKFGLRRLDDRHNFISERFPNGAFILTTDVLGAKFYSWFQETIERNIMKEWKELFWLGSILWEESKLKNGKTIIRINPFATSYTYVYDEKWT